ncbi:MAG: hypothetical protein HXY38_07415 [Chloroflexi bacterium]|nr:hypothetical protein [Chloroflexota bacterium]
MFQEVNFWSPDHGWLKKSRRQTQSPAGQLLKDAAYFFFVPGFDAGDFDKGFDAGFFALEGAPLGAGVVFVADEGFEARFRFDADTLAVTAEAFSEAALFTTAFLSERGSGSVFTAAEAGASSFGKAGSCFAASRQFGKNNSIRWREMELARRQRGQWAS